MKNLILLITTCCIYSFANAQIAPGKQMHGYMNLTTKVNGMGKKINIAVKYYFSGTFIANLPDDTKEWEMVIDSMVMKGKEGKKDMYINSNDPTTMEDEKFSKFKDQIGKKVVVLLDKDGHINAKDSTITPPEFVKYCFMPVPKDKQKVGYTWAVDDVQNMNGIELNVKVKNKVTAIEKNNLTINSVTEIDNDMMDLDPVTTNYITDAQTGLVKTATMAMKMSMMKIMKMEIITDYKATW
jgi:hypothetical protein